MRKSLLKPLASGFLLLAFAFVSKAQTPTENLQKGVEQYNAMKEYVNGLNAKTITAADIEGSKNRMERGLALLEKAIHEGTAEQIKVGRYFRANFKYQYVFALGMKGENAKALPVLKEIETDMTALSQSDFPLRYEYFEKKFIIKWEDFAPTQGEFYVSYAEIAYNNGKFEDASRLARKALDHPNLTDWLKYIAVNKILDMDAKGTPALPKNERRDFALRGLKLYDGLGEDFKTTIRENNYPTVLRGSELLLDALKQDASQPYLQAAAEGAMIAGKYRPEGQSSVTALFDGIYKANHKGGSDFNKAALAYAKSANASDKTATKNIGTAALAALVAATPSANCSDFKNYAADYRFFGNALDAQKLDARARQCEIDRAAEEKRQEELRQKQAEAERRRARRANRFFNVYLGFDLFPAIATADKIDLGGHIDLRGRRWAHSFGYSKVKRKKDLFSGNQDWDGTRMFYAFKVFGRETRNQVTYSGLYFGLSDKVFDPLDAQLSPKDPTTGNFTFGQVTPNDKQYELLWNSGMQVLGFGMGMDVWFGVGAAYHQLSYPEFDIDQYEFSGHEFFEKRKKKDAIGVRMRLGMSIGLNFGKKRR